MAVEREDDSILSEIGCEIDGENVERKYGCVDIRARYGSSDDSHTNYISKVFAVSR